MDPVAFNNALSASNTSWWCSNGLFNQVGSTNTLSNVSQQIPDNANQRQELAMVGCPQLGKACGNQLTDIDTATTAAKVISVANDTLTTKNKCTWVGYAKLSNPSFLLNSIIPSSTSGCSTSCSTTAVGIKSTSKWQIHHMEYNNDQLPI